MGRRSLRAKIVKQLIWHKSGSKMCFSSLAGSGPEVGLKWVSGPFSRTSYMVWSELLLWAPFCQRANSVWNIRASRQGGGGTAEVGTAPLPENVMFAQSLARCPTSGKIRQSPAKPANSSQNSQNPAKSGQIRPNPSKSSKFRLYTLRLYPPKTHWVSWEPKFHNHGGRKLFTSQDWPLFERAKTNNKALDSKLEPRARLN